MTDVQITDKLFMPADSAYLTEVKKGNTSKVVDLINQEAKKAGYIKVLRVVPKGVDSEKVKPIDHADWVVPDNEIGHAYLDAYDGSDWKTRSVCICQRRLSSRSEPVLKNKHTQLRTLA